jgi:hypothetical protein
LNYLNSINTVYFPTASLAYKTEDSEVKIIMNENKPFIKSAKVQRRNSMLQGDSIFKRNEQENQKLKFELSK